MTERDPVELHRYLRSTDAFPTDHFVFGPLFVLAEDTFDAHADAVVHWIDTWQHAPAVARFQDLVTSAEGILQNNGDPRGVARARGWLSRAEALAEGLDSDTARARCVAVAIVVADVEGSDVEVGDLLERARWALGRVTEPSGGDLYLAARYLRLVSRCGDVTGADLRRPLEWALGAATPVGLVLSQISTAVALVRLGNEPLAALLAATISGEKARRSVVRIHRDALPTSIVDDLIHHPEGDESVENVLADIVAFAAELDAGLNTLLKL